jgi:archaellin
LPDGSDFPSLSDLTRPTDFLEDWWHNATEKFVASQPGTTDVSGNKLWLRKINLTVYDASGEGVNLSNMRINFTVKKMTNASPNQLYARVYNLSKKTQEKVRSFHRVQLSAGYRSQFGMIFDGTVVLYVQGKENTVDTYIDIFAGDAEEALNNGSVLLTLPAGTKPSQRIREGLQQNGVKIGTIDVGKGEQQSLRSSTYAGMLRDFIRDQTNATASDFFIDDGEAQVISREGYRPGEKVILKPTTGLIGLPQVTPQGIEAKCLLNPKLRLATQVEIQTDILSNVPYQPGTSEPFHSGQPLTNAASFGPQGQQQFQFAATSPTGTYKIILLEHTGDTRGTPWYSVMVCVAIGNDGKAIGTPQDAFTRRSVFLLDPSSISTNMGGTGG